MQEVKSVSISVAFSVIETAQGVCLNSNAMIAVLSACLLLCLFVCLFLICNNNIKCLHTVEQLKVKSHAPCSLCSATKQL